MAYRDDHLVRGVLVALSLSFWAGAAAAQNAPGASFPPDPAPAPTPPASVAPTPTPASPPPVPAAPPAPAPQPASAAAPGPAAPPLVAPTPPPAPPPYSADPNRQPGYGAAYGEPPPPPPAPPEDEKSAIPPFSVRVDPFNWILEGQLGFELEVGLTKWLSVETVPVFVVDKSPPWLNFGGGDSRIYQRSNGWGPLSGTSIGVNFWPSKLFRGYVIRTGLNNYALEYETKAGDGARVDSFSHTKRQFYLMLGSAERWGAFTIGGGLGLGYDLNKESRCIANATVFDPADAKPGNCDELQIAVPVGTNTVSPVAVSPFTYPWEFLVRISLGVVID